MAFQELIYHSVAALLLIIASVLLLIAINDSNVYRAVYKPLLAASVRTCISHEFLIKLRQICDEKLYLTSRSLAYLMDYYMLSVHITHGVHIKAFKWMDHAKFPRDLC